MIDSTSSFDRTSRAQTAPDDLSVRPQGLTGRSRDRLSTDKAEQLSSALANQPEIRPEMVARGRALAADPSYPGSSVLSQVAAQIANSPDLSEDQE